MQIIGLGHKARQGKDTLGRFVAQEAATRGMNVRVYGFADSLRAYCRVAFGMREKDAPLLQVVGTDIFRKRDPDIWCRVLMDTIREQQPDLAIVTDVRFENEAAVLKTFGAKLFKISRTHVSQDPTLNGTPWIAGDRDPRHPSETALENYDGWDMAITVEDGGIAKIQQVARGLFEMKVIQ